ncbi:hypothetical protein AWC38_SpisGene21233 [Stylophora pistillata]|uniref:Uncharacterized protein n=1 Tax=Stylophora pistillata TaxID=50429 RepID=A0A2B4RE92_STYPI|nr:hypothetical protein AWC38_SpisGene21233 [Stylophora pistillata]
MPERRGTGTDRRAEDVIEADDGVMTSESALLSDKEILEEFRERDSTVMEVDDDSDDDDSEERPQHRQPKLTTSGRDSFF